MSPADDALDIVVPDAVAGETVVRITHPAKVFFSERGETKLDLVRYYEAVAEPFLAEMRGRPTLMQRFPDGASGKSFFQKRVPTGIPDWLQTTIVSTANGTTSDALVIADLAHALWAVNMGCLGFHPWPYRVDDEAHADELRIDLDPVPGVDFEMLRAAAFRVCELLGELAMVGYPKTSGNRGIHIFVGLMPEWDSYAVRSAAVALARELERRHPETITSKWWKEERGTRVFVDFNQNAPHKTVFGAWSARARVGGQVSTPLTWDELALVDIDALTISTVPARLAGAPNPWAEMYRTPQSLAPLLELAERDAAAGLPDAPWPPQYPKMPREESRVAPSRAKKEPGSAA